MAIYRMQVALTGGSMGSGVATHYWDNAVTHQAHLKTFWTSVAAIMSGYVTIVVPNTGEVFDETTGALLSVWSSGTSSSITGGGTGAYAGGVGACIGWNTSGIHNSRKVRGRTFIVPLAANVYDTDGTLASGTITTINSAVSTLLTSMAGDLNIWARPSTAVPVGGAYPVTAGVVKDHVSWLRSRR